MPGDSKLRGDSKMPGDSHATRIRAHAEDLDLDLDGRTWTFWIADGPGPSGSRTGLKGPGPAGSLDLT